MKNKITLFILLLIATTNVHAQLNWYYHDFPSYTGHVTNPNVNEKTIIKTDLAGNLYSLVRTYDDGLGMYLPRLQKETSAGALAWQIADAAEAAGGQNYFIVGLEVASDGTSFCLLSRLDGTGYRTLSYSDAGILLWLYDVHPWDNGCYASALTATDIKVKNNKVYSLANLYGFPASGWASCRYTVVNINTNSYAFSDTTPSCNAAKMDISNTAVWVVGSGASQHKWFTQINKYNLSNHLIATSRTDGLFSARANKNEIPLMVKCSPATGLPYIVGVSTDTLDAGGYASGSPNSFDLMIIRPNAANTTMKLKVHNITANKKDIPTDLVFNSVGDLVGCGLTNKSGFVTSINGTTLARNWTTKIKINDSTAFTASAFYNDNYAVVGDVYKSSNNSISTIAVRIKLSTGAYNSVAYGAANFTNDKWQVTSACMNQNDAVSFGGQSSNYNISTNNLYTGQFDFNLLPRIENEIYNSDIASDDFNLYPNPAVNDLNISFDSKNEDAIYATVINMQGQVLMQNNFNAVSGSNTYNLNLSTLSSGVYVIQLLNSNGEIKSHRFIKQ